MPAMATPVVDYAAPLYAGQNTFVGSVVVLHDDHNLRVVYGIFSSGWKIHESQVAVGTSLADIPQKNGNPIPGKFAYSQLHDPPVKLVIYDIPLPGSSPVYVAAHAEVVHETGGVTDRVEGAWAGSQAGTESFPGKNWATYFTFTPIDNTIHF